VVREQLADLESAREFYQAVSSRTEVGLGAVLVSRLEERSDMVRALLDGEIGHHQLDEVLSLFFGVRRRRKAILGAFSQEQLVEGLQLLRSGDCEGLDVLGVADETGEFGLKEFGKEVLHALYPEQFGLWTRWVFDPDAETGALLLVLNEEVDLFGVDDREVLERVTEASRYLLHTLSAAELGVSVEHPFSLDVFLGGVYAVYAQTVLQMRMTKEFNRLLPDMGEFIERLLGVRKIGRRDASRR
jgi:hypothetical protein